MQGAGGETLRYAAGLLVGPPGLEPGTNPL